MSSQMDPSQNLLPSSLVKLVGVEGALRRHLPPLHAQIPTESLCPSDGVLVCQCSRKCSRKLVGITVYVRVEREIWVLNLVADSSLYQMDGGVVVSGSECFLKNP